MLFEQCCFNASCFSNLPSVSFFIPSAPFSRPSSHPADIRETLGLFPISLMFRTEEQVPQIGTVRQGQPQWNICLNTLRTLPPPKGLQVKFCPWEVGPRLSSCSRDHNSVTPQQELPGCCCGRCCLTPQHICVGGWTTHWLCPRRIAARYPQWRTKPLVVLSLKMERCMTEPCF